MSPCFGTYNFFDKKPATHVQTGISSSPKSENRQSVEELLKSIIRTF